MLHLTQLQGGAGGAAAISPQLELNLAAFEASLRSYIDGDDTQQPFDVVSRHMYHWLGLAWLVVMLLVIVALLAAVSVGVSPGCGGYASTTRAHLTPYYFSLNILSKHTPHTPYTHKQSCVPKVAPEPKLAPKGAAGGMASAAAASAAAYGATAGHGMGGGGGGGGGLLGSDGGAAAAAAAAAQYEAIIKARPEFAVMGKLFKSSAPVRWGVVVWARDDSCFHNCCVPKV